MKPLLTARDLRVRYRKNVALEVPYLALFAGEVLAVLGPNGSGKSTLLRVLAALQRPDAGELTFRGQRLDWRRTLAYRRRIAVVLQDPLLLDTSVWRNVALRWYLRGRWGRDVAVRVRAWLARFHIEHLAQQPALTLSGGEARRVALARALVLEPEILFLDEPFSGLDVPTREEILSDLRGVLQATGTTTLLVTHDREEALALADRVAVLLDGHIRQVGPPHEVFQHPADLAVARFVGMENLWSGEVIGERGPTLQVRLENGLELNVPRSGTTSRHLWVGVRPEHVQLALHPPQAENTWPGHVMAAMPLGFRVNVTVDVHGQPVTALLSYSQASTLGLEEGQPVYVTVAPEHVHVFSDTTT